MGTFLIYKKIRNVPISQRGSVLLPVIVAITLLAAITLMLGSQAVMRANITTGEREFDQLRYVAEAGLAHAKLRVGADGSCKAYGDMAKVDFTGGSYTAQISPKEGSPVTISATALAADGRTVTLDSRSVPVYESLNTVVIQMSDSSGADAILDDFYPIRNYGGSGGLKIESDGWIQRPVLRFDLDAIPKGATVLSAQFELRQFNLNAPGTVYVHRMTRDWVEGTRNGGGIADGATWETFDGTTAWTLPGGDFDPNPYSSATVVSGPEWAAWDVTALVQDWVSGAAINHGMLLNGDGTVRNGGYASRETNNPSDAPRLTITWACECGKICTGDNGNVLMVVADVGSLTAQEEAKRSLMESWGFAVNLIGEDEDPASYDAAFDTNDAVFVSEDVNELDVNSKLTKAPIGVVTEEPYLADDLALSQGLGVLSAASEITIDDNTHYITEGFSTGALTIVNTPSNLYYVTPDLAPDLRGLGGLTSVWALATVDTGGNLVGGIQAAGRRVFLPWGGNDFEIIDLTAAGLEIFKRSLEWAMGAEPARRLLLVVEDPASLLVQESAKKALFESWGYIVSLIDESDTQANFDAAAADNDVVFITEDIASGNVNTKLVNATIGVVTEEDNLSDEFGFSDGIAWGSGTALDIDSTHYITQPLSSGSVTILTATESLADLTGTLAPDIEVIGLSSGKPALATLDLGASLTPGGTAAGRRVILPWGGDNFDVKNLNAEGLTILQRSLEWASGLDGITGPIAHWMLDEGAGTLAADSIGGNDGTLIGSPAWIAGHIGNGVAFDPADGEDYVDIPNTPALENVQEDDYTLAAWFRPDSTPPGTGGDNDANYGILIKAGWHTGIYYNNGNRFSFDQVLDGDTGVGINSTDTFSPGSFYHVAAVVDRSAGTQSIYVNGLLQGSTTFTPGAAAREYGTESWKIGIAYSGATSWGWAADGAIDDVRIYDRALDASEIAELAAMGGSGGGGGGNGACNGNYLDQFEVYQFDNSDGTLDWSTRPWQEIGESDGPAAGDIRIWSDLDSIRIRTRDSDNGGEGIEREADLSGAATASLSYDYRRDRLDSSSDYATVEISSNGASGPWTELARYEGPTNDGAYATVSHDISAFIAANTRIRFKTSPSMGNLDNVWFDNIEISCSP